MNSRWTMATATVTLLLMLCGTSVPFSSGLLIVVPTTPINRRLTGPRRHDQGTTVVFSEISNRKNNRPRKTSGTFGEQATTFTRKNNKNKNNNNNNGSRRMNQQPPKKTQNSYEQDPFNDDDHHLFGNDKADPATPNVRPSDDSSTTTTTTTTSPESSHFFSRKSLEDAVAASLEDGNISIIFRDLCRGAGIDRPSRIQSLAWPVLMTGKPAIVADQTGSGKTLAYLIPLLLRALQQPRSIKTPGTPRILILSPTSELADQTRAVCDKLSHYVKFRTMVVTANGKYATSIRDQIRLLQRTEVEVLISTPGRLSTILRTRNAGVDLSQLSSIVLDEVDVLLVDETFGPQLRTVGAAAPVHQTQFVFCTATLPNQIVETVQREFPGVVQVRGPGLHRVAPTVHERLIDVSVPPSLNRDPDACFQIKADELLKALRETKCRRTLIFCNTIESCRAVENLLQRNDRRGQLSEVIPYHNALTPQVRNQNLKLFSRGRSNGGNDTADYVLVCTDRAARGVDFDAAPVDHVVIFDFPKDPAEYVRRVGRTARAGRSGTCTVLAFGWQLPIARKVMGKTLEIFAADEEGSIANDDDDKMHPAEDVKKRRKGQSSNEVAGRRMKDQVVKSNIEEKRLWKD